MKTKLILGSDFFCSRALTSLAFICAAGLLATPNSAPGATFAPTEEERVAATEQGFNGELKLAALPRNIDAEGRTYVEVDDMLFWVREGAGVESAFTGNRWTNGIVYYVFDAAVSSTNRQNWRDAAADWSAVARLTFTESTGTGNYIYVQNGSGNNSYVGMIGGRQVMNIHSWYEYIIAHEIGHALGLIHEHQRSDRNSYVTINYSYIQSQYAFAFDIAGSTNYGTYDFDSTMHYGKCAFSIDCPPGYTCGCTHYTITVLPPNTQWQNLIGQRTHLSQLDGTGMAQRYGGPTPTPTATATATPSGTPSCTPSTINEGFDHITNLPGWSMINHSQPLGVTNWLQGDGAAFPTFDGSPTAYIAANFDNGAGLATISNWLLTPVQNLRNGNVLTFYTRTTNVGPQLFPDRLQVRMSTNGASTNVGTTATDVGDFTALLLDINPTYDDQYPHVWTLFTVTISGVPSPTTGRLAFRYFVENGGPSGANSDYIGIDRVVYNGPCPSGSPTPTPTATATATPTATPTATATATPTSTATPTATATPSPAVATNPATNVASVFATLNGSVNPRGATTTVYFQWGTTTSYGHTTPAQIQTGNTYRPITANIIGLSAGRLYHFRIVATNGGGTSFSPDRTFTTLSAPPVVTTNPATFVASHSFTANWHSASGAIGYRLDVATNNSFTNYVPGYQNLNVGNALSRSVTGLNASTTYHYRVRAYNGNGTSGNSNVVHVTTLSPTGPPVVITNPATLLTGHSARLNGTVDPHGLNTTVYFQYGRTTSYGSRTPNQTRTGYNDQNVFANIPGLSAHTTYHFRIVASNSVGTRYGTDRTFTTQ